MSNTDFAIITFADKEPYITETRNLEYYCEYFNAPFERYDYFWLSQQKTFLENYEFFKKPKVGYCAWKPMIILDALKKHEHVVYLDSSMIFVKERMQEFVNKTEILLSTITPLKIEAHSYYETFDILEINFDKFKDKEMVWSGIISATQKAKPFMKKWLAWMLTPNCFPEKYNIEKNKNLKYFLFDQPIYSVLYIMNNFLTIENDAYCFDTREFSHRPHINRIFGNKIMKNQDSLIRKYAGTYITNGSCRYNPDDNPDAS